MSITAYGQSFSGEFGILGGVSYYLGDINQTKQFYSPSPAIGVLYRHNFNPRYALRVQALYAGLKASDSDFKNGYQQSRNASFSRNLYELGTSVEFNFLTYDPVNIQNFTPFVIAGVNLTLPGIDNKPFFVTLPIGAGLKFALTKKLTLDVEWVFRKTFTDNLDNLKNTSDEISGIKQKTNQNTKDWYSIAGVSLSYNFTSKTKWCSAYGKQKKY